MLELWCQFIWYLCDGACRLPGPGLVFSCLSNYQRLAKQRTWLSPFRVSPGTEMRCSGSDFCRFAKSSERKNVLLQGLLSGLAPCRWRLHAEVKEFTVTVHVFELQLMMSRCQEYWRTLSSESHCESTLFLVFISFLHFALFSFAGRHGFGTNPSEPSSLSWAGH